MPQIWKIEKEEDREKEKIRRQASEAQREKDLQRDRKNKEDIFCWMNNMKFCSGGEKIRNASGQLGENERQWKKSEQEHVRYFLHKTCSQEVSRYSRAKQRQINVQKKCAARAKLLFY